jgi:hypothetical protein
MSNVHPTERYQPPTDPDYCVNCGSRPAVRVGFQRVLGLLVFSQREIVNLVLCRGCGQATGRKMTSRTLLTGWWGLLAILWNVVGLARNTRSLHQLGRLTEPDRAGWAPPGDPGRPVVERWSTIIFCFGVVALVLILAF